MKDVINKMGKQLPEGLVYHYIFLAAGLAIGPQHFGTAIQAIFFFSFRLVRHAKKFS
jgi:hypothetical protein